MQSKLKTCACALALAFAAGNANAINVDGADAALGSGTGGGEFWFSLWDQGRSLSFTLDLNLAVNDFVTNEAGVVGFSVTSAALATFIAGGDVNNMLWNIGGVSNIADPTLFYTVSTMDLGSVFVPPADPSNVQLSVASAGQYIGATNTGLTSAVNDYGQFGISDGLAYFGGGAWACSWGGNYAFDSCAEVGEGATTYISRADSSNTQFILADWFLDANTGTVSYGAQVVPVPAAAWLFGSALGLLAWVRRKIAVTV